eukprot:g1871.t1
MDLFSAWQLVDSVLPTGGFCHSYGLEAAIKTKYIDAAQTPEYILESIEQAASLYLPVIRNTMEQPTLETWCVGTAFLRIAQRLYEDAAVAGISIAQMRKLVLSKDSATKLFLFHILRDMISAASYQSMNVTLGAGSLLGLIPEPVCMFKSAQYKQEQHFKLSSSASLVLLDWFTSGRTERGEAWQFNEFQSVNRVEIDGRLVFLDPLCLKNREGSSIAARMRQINVVAILVLFGPRTQEMVDQLLSTKRPSFEGRESVQAAETDGVMCIASPLQAGGAIVRLAAPTIGSAREHLKGLLAPLEREFGKTPAWECFEGEGCAHVSVPLDLTNPATLDYQMSAGVIPAQKAGYNAIALDNYNLGNSWAACGAFKGPNGTWVQIYDAANPKTDPKYKKDVLDWTERAVAAIHKEGLLVIPNFSGLSLSSAGALAVGNLTDGILAEAGFAEWNPKPNTSSMSTLPPKTTPAKFEEQVNFVRNLQRAGKGFFAINEWGPGPDYGLNPSGQPHNITKDVRQFVVAAWMMCNGRSSGIFLTCIQCYGGHAGGLGNFSIWPEYSAPVGHPLSEPVKDASTGVWTRGYSGGITIVNPGAEPRTVALPEPQARWTELDGTAVANTGAVPLPPASGLVLLRPAAADEKSLKEREGKQAEDESASASASASASRGSAFSSPLHLQVL